MAYISVEETREIRNGLKEAFKGTDVRFSVKNLHHSVVSVTVLRGPISEEVVDKYFDKEIIDYPTKFYRVVESVMDIVKVHSDSNFGDMGADYPDFTYHRRIKFGAWDKPFVNTEGTLDYDKLNENIKKFEIKRTLRKGK